MEMKRIRALADGALATQEEGERATGLRTLGALGGTCSLARFMERMIADTLSPWQRAATAADAE